MFLFTERKFIESLKRYDDVAEYFPEYIVDFLRQKNRLHVVQNKIIIREPWGDWNTDDLVQSAEIVQLHTNFNISDYVTKILKEIDDPFRFYIDLSMILKTSK